MTGGTPNITRVREMLGVLASRQPTFTYARPPTVEMAFWAVRLTARIHVAFRGAVQCQTRSIHHPIDVAVSDRVDEAVIDMLTHDLGRERQMSAHPPSRTTLEKQPAFWAFERLDTSRADGVQASGFRPGTTDLRDLAEGIRRRWAGALLSRSLPAIRDRSSGASVDRMCAALACWRTQGMCTMLTLDTRGVS